MNILCLDPSKRATGYAVYNCDNESIAASGVVTPKGADYECHELLQRFLEDLIDIYDVQGIVSEDPAFFGSRQGGSSSNKILTAIAVMVHFLAEKNEIPELWLSPSQLKLLWTGNGKAEKHEVEEKVVSVFKLKPEDDNESDALALAGILKEMTLQGLISLIDEKKQEKAEIRKRRSKKRLETALKKEKGKK